MKLGLLLVAGFAVAACGDDDPDRGRRVRPGDTVYTDPISQNEEFSFTPGPEGAHPGMRVEVYADPDLLLSDDFEVYLQPWDGVTTVERPLNTEGEEGPALVGGALQRFSDRLTLGPEDLYADETVLDRVSLTLNQPPAAVEPRTAEAIFQGQLARIQAAVAQAEGAENGNKANECPEGSRAPFTAWTEIGAIGPQTLWLGNSFGFSDLSFVGGYAWVFHPAPEGMYMTLQRSVALQLIPAIGISVNTNYGFLRDEDTMGRGRFAAATIEGRSFSFSLTIEVTSFGFTMFLKSPGQFHTAMQADLGVGFSVSLANLFGPLVSIPFNLTVAEGQVATRNPNTDEPVFIFISGWGGGCSGPLPASSKSNLDLSDDVGFSELVSNIELMRDTADQRETPALAAFASMLSESLLPVARIYAEQDGATPATGITAGSNGALIRNFAGQPGSQICASCADTTVDGFLARTIERMSSIGDDDNGLIGGTLDSLIANQAVVPQPELLRAQGALVAGVVDATFALGFEYAANDGDPDPNRYTSDDVIDIPAQAGQPVYFEFTAEEIGALVGRPAADIEGATVCVQADFGGPRLEDSCVVLTDGYIDGAITFDSTTQLLFYANVDLSTAAGEFPEDVADWTVRPAIRRAVVRAGPVDHVALTGSSTIYSGAPATLNATIVDALGNAVQGFATYRFFDGEGELLTTLTSDTGYATYQFQPSGLTPAATAFAPATFIASDESEVTGFSIVGDNLSDRADVLINGQNAREMGYFVGSIDSTELYIVAGSAQLLESLGLSASVPISSGDRVQVLNPGGAAADQELVVP
jgi:hypothetical protein